MAIYIKQDDGSLRASTICDSDQFSHVKTGRPIEIKGVRKSERSLLHHQMYWAGLIPLCLEYWKPTGGLNLSALRIWKEPNSMSSTSRFSLWHGAYAYGKPMEAKMRKWC